MTDEQIRELQEIKINCDLNTKRLDKLDTIVENIKVENRAIFELNTTVKVLAETMADMKNDIKDVKTDVKDNLSSTKEEIEIVKDDIQELRNKPFENKSGIFDKIIWLIVSGVIAIIVSEATTRFM